MSDVREVIANAQVEFLKHVPVSVGREGADAVLRALAENGYVVKRRSDRNFQIGERVTKIKGSSWTGPVCGFYSTYLTPNGYCVESENEPGSVQIYPEGALLSAPPLKEND